MAAAGAGAAARAAGPWRRVGAGAAQPARRCVHQNDLWTSAAAPAPAPAMETTGAGAGARPRGGAPRRRCGRRRSAAWPARGPARIGGSTVPRERAPARRTRPSAREVSAGDRRVGAAAAGAGAAAVERPRDERRGAAAGAGAGAGAAARPRGDRRGAGLPRDRLRDDRREGEPVDEFGAGRGPR